MTGAAINQPVRGNNATGTDRLHDMPRVKAYNTSGEAGHGPGAAFVGWTNYEYDTDGMYSTSFITCQTAGRYELTAHAELNAALATEIGVQVFNPALTKQVLSWTGTGVRVGFAKHVTVSGPWVAQVGDQIGLYVYTSGATDIAGGQSSLYLEACLTSL